MHGYYELVENNISKRYHIPFYSILTTRVRLKMWRIARQIAASSPVTVLIFINPVSWKLNGGACG